ncbi:MAG: phosphotransferase family protein [Christensenellales bacterium]|jgi:serine/threonine-protein kinase RIO1
MDIKAGGSPKLSLFREEITDWASWGRVFQSVEAFAPLIRHVYELHGLPAADIERLTPGTNAVFRLGETVVKIYSPKESGNQQDMRELFAMRRAEKAGVRVPKVLAHGKIGDKYDFDYIVMEFAQGKEAGEALPNMSHAERASFFGELRENLRALNTQTEVGNVPWDMVSVIEENRRWDGFDAGLRREIISWAKGLDKREWVFVHGDLTGENLLIEKKGGIQMIDFGDCHMAPFYCEWPPIAAELLCWDEGMIAQYFAKELEEGTFLPNLARAICLHDFGGDFLKNICADMNEFPKNVKTMDDVRGLVHRRLGGLAR